MGTFGVFESIHYQTYLRKRFGNKENRGEMSRLAEFIPCQKSYLSRVLKEEVHFTPDQAFRATEFFKFSNVERNYFLAAVEWARAGEPSYRKFLETNLKTMKIEFEESKKSAHREPVPVGGDHSQYFYIWCMPIIHILTSLPQCQTIETIAARTSLAPVFVEKILQNLVSFGYCKQLDNRYVWKTGERHLNPKDPMISVFHRNLREEAVRNSVVSPTNALHFSMVQSLSRKDFEMVRNLIISCIDQYNHIASPSDPETAIIFNIDYFEI